MLSLLLLLLNFPLLHATVGDDDAECTCSARASRVTPLPTRPCLVRGALSSAQAAIAAAAVRGAIRRDALLVKGGSGAAVAHFDGGADEARELDAAVAHGSNYVVFDTSSAAHTALAAAQRSRDWPTAVLRPWLAPAAQRERRAWATLSDATRGSGLPPHVHGDSVLILLEGEKRWAWWEPEQLLPEAVRAALPAPLQRSASAVFGALLGSNASAPRLPLLGGRICHQHSGDVALIPAGAYHATIAPSERTLGVGSQREWPLRARLRLARAALSRGSANVSAHALLGLGLAQQGGSGARRRDEAARHLAAVLRAEPTNVRVAISLSDLVATTDRTAAAAVVASAARAIGAALAPSPKASSSSRAGGEASTAASSIADARASSAALRRLVATLARHGDAGSAKAALKLALQLDPQTVMQHIGAMGGSGERGREL